jgi:G3E family GTPase
VLLNKMDLITSEEAAEVATVIRQINPVADVVPTTFSKVEDLRELLSINTTRSADQLTAALRGQPDTAPGTVHSVHTCSIELPGSLDSRRAMDFLCRDLLYHDNETFEVVRIKAAIWVAGELIQLQGIGETYDTALMEGWTVPTGVNRFLILGRNLNASRITEIIQSHLKR